MVDVFWSVLFLSLSAMTSAACADIDSQACTLFAQANPDVCKDPTLSSSACPKYCNLCSLECYQCQMTSADRDTCNTTRLCAVGESCLLKEVRSTGDGHTQFTMTCATDQICDGDEPLTVFGRRKRNVAMTCCKTDLCNTPTSIFSPSTSTVASSSTSIKTTPQTVCDTSGGFQLLSFHEQMCVKLHRSPHKWDAARRICQGENADLVVLDTADKRRAVTNYVTSTIGHPVNYWIGLRDHLDIDTFQWVNAVYVSNTDDQWGVGQPDQMNQNCVFVKKEDHLWHDWLCSESFSFVCERNM